MSHFLLVFLALLQSLTAPPPANSPAPDIPEAGSVEAIAAATGDPRFLSPWVSYLPQSSTIVSPRTFLGRIPGAPGEFVDTAKSPRLLPRTGGLHSPRAGVYHRPQRGRPRKSSCLPSPTKPASAISSALKAATAALADPSPHGPGRCRTTRRQFPSHLLFQRRLATPTKPAPPKPPSNSHIASPPPSSP